MVQNSGAGHVRRKRVDVNRQGCGLEPQTGGARDAGVLRRALCPDVRRRVGVVVSDTLLWKCIRCNVVYADPPLDDPGGPDPKKIYCRVCDSWMLAELVTII